MKCFSLNFLPLLILFAPVQAVPQSADRLVLEGRAFLRAKDLVRANETFAHAKELDPSHQTARGFLAATRLLSLAHTETSQNLLDRLGVGLSGRDIYNWSASPPTNGHGNLIPPNQFNAEEAVAFLRTNVLEVLSLSLQDLSSIDDPYFLLSLTKEETTLDAVVVDHADIQMLRAAGHAAKCLILLLHAHNFDGQLNVLATLDAAGLLSAQGILDFFPRLLTMAKPSDLVSAREEFSEAVHLYMASSEAIRRRPQKTIRLFNFDSAMLEDEAQFRSTLAGLTNSFRSPTTVSWSTNSEDRIVVYTGAFFAGQLVLSEYLPAFHNDFFVSGSFLDPTFGGIFPSFAGQSYNLERYAIQVVRSVPKFTEYRIEGTQVYLAVNTPISQEIQVSQDLKRWQSLGSFSPVDGRIELRVAIEPRVKFFRCKD